MVNDIQAAHNSRFHMDKGLFIFSSLLVVLLIVYVWANSFKEIWLMNALLIAMFCVCVYVQIKQKTYGTLFFYVTYFLFLLSTVFFGLFKSDYKYQFYNEEAEIFALNCLVLGIVGVYIGTFINAKITIGKLNEGRENRAPSYSSKLQKFLKYAFCVTVQCSLAEALVKAVYVGANSYVAYYSDFQTPLPYAVLWVSQVSTILFYFYLGTLPNKRDARIPCVLYFLVGVIALFYGQRNVVVIRTLILLCYCFVRNRYADGGEVWISKKQIVALVALIPVVIIFMSFWNSYRFDNQYESKGAVDNVIEGLLEQGNDISILDYEYELGDRLQDKPYAIGGIIGLLRNNIISRILGIQPVPTQQNTVDMAMNGYSYCGALMYYQNRNGYLMGFGIGSCYLAELFDTFGFVGVFLGSVLYGLVLKKLTTFKLKGFIVNGFALAMFQQLLMAPRATFDGFISSTFQVSYLFCAVICWGMSKYMWPGNADE